MLDGNKKYGRLNWRKGMPQEVILDSLLRHIQALQQGEVLVPDSEHGATHWDAIMSNAMMLSELRPDVLIDATSLDDEPAHQKDWVAMKEVWGSKGIDPSGYCYLTGFNREGWHRTHNGDDCNCPSCR